MQSESEIEGRRMEQRRLVGLLVVLDVVETVRVVGVVVDFGAGRVEAVPEIGTGIKRTGMVVAIGLEHP